MEMRGLFDGVTEYKKQEYRGDVACSCESAAINRDAEKYILKIIPIFSAPPRRGDQIRFVAITSK
jgi:hypothetical protein